MKIATTKAEIDALARPLVLVPTMGALHAGHASLIEQGTARARERGWAGGCAVTIFVNPTQFNEKSDFERYPRTMDADAAACAAAGASCVIVPDVAIVYPHGLDVGVPELPATAVRPRLEDAQRPGHFAGVCQVVRRLFELVRPGAAVFGEKDWQQLQVVREMVWKSAIPVEIIPGPTVREPDGLAMSSRNRFLSPDDRRRAGALSRALRASALERDPDRAEAVMAEVLASEAITPDYGVVRDAATLVREPGSVPGVRYRALIAARVGAVRLLDNTPWPG